jgi:hypothetical protein
MCGIHYFWRCYTGFAYDSSMEFGRCIACVPAVDDIPSGICQRKPANSPTYHFKYWQGFLLKRWTISMMKDNRHFLLMSMKRTFAHPLLPNFEQGKLMWIPRREIHDSMRVLFMISTRSRTRGRVGQSSIIETIRDVLGANSWAGTHALGEEAM